MPEITVIIPTHNPRRSYLERTLDGLRAQTFCRSSWDLLIVDNASTEPVSSWADLSWHTSARVVREDILGLTPARLRGFHEAKSELIVLVDDDNVLAPNYLERAIEIASCHPNLGAWSGQVLPEYEISPPDDIRPFLHVLCIRDFIGDHWGNHRDPGKLPFGAGMCVRRLVAARYASTISNSGSRFGLDRKGDCLASSGDLDLALTSVDLGLGTGLFAHLNLTHLIPAKRLDRAYILRLIEDSSMGHYIFEKERGLPHAPHPSGIDKIVAQYKLLRATPMQKAVDAAIKRGIRRAQTISRVE